MRPLTFQILIAFTALSGATSVGLGAWGAHGLAETLAERNMVAVWETAVFYHLIHSVALLALLLYHHVIQTLNPSCRPPIRFPLFAWVGGVLLFSGSLYLLALGAPGAVFGPITPLGGIAFLLGWLSLFRLCQPLPSATN